MDAPEFQLAPPDTGVLFVVTGPSGVGKTTLVREAMRRIPGINFSVSATTRPPRTGEVDGRDYHFLDDEKFEELQQSGALLEHAQVYDRKYGTPKAPVVDALESGASILLDIDLRGARQVKQAMPDAVLVYLMPPDLHTLERRLRGRKTDSEEVISSRLRQVAEQLRGAPEFDYIVVNDDLPTAHAAFQGVLLAQLCRVHCREKHIQRVLAELPSGE